MTSMAQAMGLGQMKLSSSHLSCFNVSISFVIFEHGILWNGLYAEKNK